LEILIREDKLVIQEYEQGFLWQPKNETQTKNDIWYFQTDPGSKRYFLKKPFILVVKELEIEGWVINCTCLSDVVYNIIEAAVGTVFILKRPLPEEYAELRFHDDRIYTLVTSTKTEDIMAKRDMDALNQAKSRGWTLEQTIPTAGSHDRYILSRSIQQITSKESSG
jgi:hypothetical protein